MTPTLTRDERAILFLEITLSDFPELPVLDDAFAQHRYDRARALRWEYDALFALMDALHCWSPTDPSHEFPLTMPADQLGRVLRRIIRHATRRLIRLATNGHDTRKDPSGNIEQCSEVTSLCCDLLDQLADATAEV